MGRLRTLGVPILFGLAMVVLPGCDRWRDRPVRQLRLSLVTNIEHSLYKGATRFADLVRERTRGKVVVTVYPNSQLAGGSLVRELEMLREGTIDLSLTSNLIYSNVDSRFFACSVPWLFSTDEAVDRFLTGAEGRSLLELTRGLGIEGLALAENGFRQITNSRRAIRTPDDLRGLRIRVPAAISTRLYGALGAEPIVMTWPAVYKALQERTIDGQENPPEVVLAFHLYDVQKHVTAWHHTYDTYVFGANRRLFESFDADTQEILRAAAREAAAYQVRLAREAARTQWRELRDRGMEVTELTGAQLQAFKDRNAAALREYEPIVGKARLDALRALDR